jgi:hypothetical protein
MTKDRISREELEEIIKATEDAGRDASELRAALAELYPAPSRNTGGRFKEEELTTNERLNRKVGALFPSGVTDEVEAQLIKIDLRFSLTELRVMCKDSGLSTRGDKKELAAKLLADGKL